MPLYIASKRLLILFKGAPQGAFFYSAPQGR